jgi:hypothetical protein
MKNSNLCTTDRLGFLQAQLAPMLEAERELKDALIASGDSSLDGDFFHASIARSEVNCLPMAVAKARLLKTGTTARWIADNSESKKRITVKVTALCTATKVAA